MVSQTDCQYAKSFHPADRMLDKNTNPADLTIFSLLSAC